MSATYKKLTKSGSKVQVESAIRDGGGVKIDTNYAKQDGYYPTLKSGLTNNFDSKLVINDKAAYTFRTTAGGEEVGDPAKVKSIIGGTVFWNQLAKSDMSSKTSTQDDVTLTRYSDHFTLSGTASANGQFDNIQQIGAEVLYPNHVYLFTGLKGASNSTWYGYLYGGVGNIYDGTIKKISSSYNDANHTLQIKYVSGSVLNVDAKINAFDLTAMFGSTVADYIYSLEQSTTGAGVAWFKKYFPKEYYAYSAPTPMHVKISGIRMNRFNQWDEQWEFGYYDGTGVAQSSDVNIRSKNFIRTVPNTTYYFRKLVGKYPNGFRVFYYDMNNNLISNDTFYGNNTFITPSNCVNMKFSSFSGVTTYNNDICINFHWDGERDGEYEPYYTQMYPVDDIELKGIPMVDTDGNLYFDGDTYWSDGTVDGNYGIVDLGTLSFGKTSQNRFYSQSLRNIIKPVLNSSKGNILCAKFITDTAGNVYSNTRTNSMCVNENADLLFYIDDTYYANNDSDDFKSAMSGVYLVYPLNTPTQSTATPFLELQERDNWGAEEIIDAHTGDVALPTSVNTDYLPDLKAKVESSPSNPDSDGDYVMHREDGENSYAPLNTWLSSNGYVKQVDLSDQITDVAGLTYTIKKAYKTGNIVTLTIRASLNNDAGELTTLFSLGSSLYSGTAIRIVGSTATETVMFNIGTDGSVKNVTSLTSGSSVYIIVSYAVA